jgi:hypothetical protein
MDASTSSALACSAAASSLKSLISIGSGLPCRSPITSGRCRQIRLLQRRLRFLDLFTQVCDHVFRAALVPGLSLTAKSPVFGSVTNNPFPIQCAANSFRLPASSSSTLRHGAACDRFQPVTSRRRFVVEDKCTLVELRQKIGAQRFVKQKDPAAPPTTITTTIQR